jgi:hypothetical protein
MRIASRPWARRVVLSPLSPLGGQRANGGDADGAKR